MGTIIYIIIGIALLTYTSVSQYNHDKEEFIKTRFRNWLWWVVTACCALLWPVLVLWATIDAIRMVKMLYR